MNLFQLGDFVLSSGEKSRWKIECDVLTDNDWLTLAQMMRRMIGPFSSVEGVPRGGLKLAEALQPFVDSGSSLHLIVDDVFTTGASLQRVVKEYWKKPNASVYTCGVVFARGECPRGVRTLFQMPLNFWPVAGTCDKSK